MLAVNAWAAGWRPFQRLHRRLGQLHGPFGADPADRLAELGWTGGESIYTARFNVEYFHVTRDGRIAIGSGGGVPGYDGRIGRSFTDDLGSARRAAAAFRVPVSAAGRHSPDRCLGRTDRRLWRPPPALRLAPRRTGAHYALGYSGNGVAPSHLAGRILAALALGSDEPITRLCLVGPPPRRLPPEPFRYIGARILRQAIVMRESREMQGRRRAMVAAPADGHAPAPGLPPWPQSLTHGEARWTDSW